jgi:CDP-glycerol glycerophosphotransferase (TagB/SpsB family)
MKFMVHLNKIKHLISCAFIFIDKSIYLLFKTVTQVDKSLIIFEGQTGRFDESSWVLYHHLKKKGKYKFVWMVGNPHKHVSTKDTKFISRYHYTFNILADYYYAKAAYSFYTHTTNPIKYKRPGQTIIFIGHGYAIKGHKGSGSSYHNFDYALATGKEAMATQAIFIGCDKSKMLPLGLPRNDMLKQHSKPGNLNPIVQGRNFSKVIIWMPTFRESKGKLSEKSCATETGLPLFDTLKKVEELNETLSSFNCVIILKLHRLQLEKEAFKRKFSNIIIISDSEIDKLGLQLYQFIGLSDALLTDYSSVSVDYLLLDKPIGYILSDIDLYLKDRGFTSNNPKDVMAGEFIYKVDEAYNFIRDVVTGKDNYAEQRYSLRKRLHVAQKGDSCELICEFFGL